MTTLLAIQDAIATTLESLYTGVTVRRSSPRVFLDNMTPPAIYLAWGRTSPSLRQRLAGSRFADDFTMTMFCAGESELLAAIDTFQSSGFNEATLTSGTTSFFVFATTPERFQADDLPQKADYGFSVTLTTER